MKGRQHEPKSPYILTATKVKQQPKRIIESDKHRGNRNGVKAKKKQIRWKWSMHKGPRYHLLVPSQYMGGGPQVKGIKGCGLVGGRKKWSILEFPLKLLWGEMFYWDSISPKRSKYELGPLDACHRGRWRRGLIVRLNLFNHLIGFIPCQICL